jgi:hypothetical protein
MALLPVEWPHKLQRLVQDLPLLEGHNGRSCSRIDVDVDADTLFALNELEARARHRKIEIPLQDGSGCLTGEMNTIIGLGGPAEPSVHVARVRISFHDVEKGSCADE